ncbi:MAG: DUF1127 domain-containing protein [Pseudorhodoplanes sp.]|uniref:DUF1127 domain-containing protein n=1 Tax=Pseudorhodoplanes sp. TaxID=1934341 RepID=UPI003D0C035E
MAATCRFQPIHRQRREPALVRSTFALVLNGMRKFARALKNRRRAGMLAGLDDRMLADIGLTRSDLRDAYAEPLWRDPTDMLAGRARDKRCNRHVGMARLPVPAPGIVPEDGFAAAGRAARPAL